MTTPTVLTTPRLIEALEAFLADTEYRDAQVVHGPAVYGEGARTLGRAVAVTVGGGPGLALDWLTDRVTVTVDCAGEQDEDYDGAEGLGLTVDRFFLMTTSRTINELRFSSSERAGGRPAPAGMDDAGRLHVSCSYIVQVGSGIQ